MISDRLLTRRTVNRSVLLGLAGLCAAGLAPGPRAQAAASTGDAVLRLPAPGGPWPVGRTELYLVDRSRPDPWDPAVPVRELMATVFYPAKPKAAFREASAPELDAGIVPLFAAIAPFQHPGLPAAGVDWGATLSHARPGLPALGVPRPVLVYSPGGGDPRGLGTAHATELAARGWVVVTVDHPGDAVAVEFPVVTAFRPQLVRPTVLTGDPRADPALFRTLIDTRTADLRFVCDRLAELASGRNPEAAGRELPVGLDRTLDLDRLGVYGHSAGGTAAAELLHEDSRIKTAVNLEGYLDYADGELLPVALRGTGDRPLLLLRTGRFPDRAALDRSWEALAAVAAPGTVVQRQFADAAHWVFTDFSALAPQLEARGLMTAADRATLVGTLPADRAETAVRRALHGFFARALGSA